MSSRIHTLRGPGPRRIRTGLLLALLTGLGACRPEPQTHQQEHRHAQHQAQPSSSPQAASPAQAANALQQEMRQLDLAFREVVSAAIVSDGKRLLAALEPLHGSEDHTRHALASGAIRLPRHPDQLKEFLAMDAAFHQELEQLARAAQGRQSQQMFQHTQSLMNRCRLCHQRFRAGS